MYRQIRTAVAAVAEERLAKRVTALLAAAGLELQYMAGDGYSAINAVLRLRPDLLIADQMLPGADGATLMRTAVRAHLPVLPDRALLCRTEFLLLPSDQPDGVTMIDIPTTNTMFREAIEDMRRMPPYVDPELMRRAKEMYRYLGFPEHIGTECLEMITVLCAQDERRMMGTLDDLEEMIAEIKQIRKRPADRAMRHVIDAAWQSDRVEEQYRVFGDSIDAGRGQPTCREMIARIADILRLEG